MQFAFEPPLGTVPALGQLDTVITFGPSGALRWPATLLAMQLPCQPCLMPVEATYEPQLELAFQAAAYCLACL